jgi:hypothetical protein
MHHTNTIVKMVCLDGCSGILFIPNGCPDFSKKTHGHFKNVKRTVTFFIEPNGHVFKIIRARSHGFSQRVFMDKIPDHSDEY